MRSGLVPPSAAAARQGEGSDPFKTLRRVVVQSGRVARPGGKGQREEWAVKFEGYDSREKVRAAVPSHACQNCSGVCCLACRCLFLKSGNAASRGKAQVPGLISQFCCP